LTASLGQGDRIGRIFVTIGDCLLWAVALKIKKVSHISVLLYHTVRFTPQLFTNNGLGYNFGDFFHKLIWSPWLALVRRNIGMPAYLAIGAHTSDRATRLGEYSPNRRFNPCAIILEDWPECFANFHH
jgi:hypothetical protein